MSNFESDATQFELAVNISGSSGLSDEARANRHLMIDAYQRIAAGDQGALIALLDSDVHFVEAPSLPYGCDVRGVSGALSGVQGMMAAWRTIRVEIEEFAAAGDLVFAYMKFTGVSRRSGNTYEGVCAELFRFRNQRITEWRPIYWDTHAAREACL